MKDHGALDHGSLRSKHPPRICALQHNGVTEHANCTIVEMARSMLHALNLDNLIWREWWLMRFTDKNDVQSTNWTPLRSRKHEAERSFALLWAKTFFSFNYVLVQMETFLHTTLCNHSSIKHPLKFKLMMDAVDSF